MNTCHLHCKAEDRNGYGWGMLSAGIRMPAVRGKSELDLPTPYAISLVGSRAGSLKDQGEKVGWLLL